MTATLCMASFDLPTHSASAFLLRHIAPRMEPFQLYGPISRRPFFSLFAPSSDVIIGTGHGMTDEYTAQDESLIWKVGQYDPREVKGKVIKLVSCFTGAQLGPDLVANGAKCFMGYDDDLTWIVDANYFAVPWNDPDAKLAFMPIVNSLQALLSGSTCGDAMAIERQGYIDSLSKTSSPLIMACLAFDLAHTVILGDENATVRRRPNINLPPPPPLLF